MNATERGMGLGLRALRQLSSAEILDRLGIRSHFDRALYSSTKNGLRSATVAGRAFKAATQLGKPARQPRSEGRGLFDLTPTDEQQMLVEAVSTFATDEVRPAASKADAECSTPKELLDQAAELGVNMLGVPEEVGGVMSERSAVAGVLVTEALAKGDGGIAVSALAPGAVATALGLWGDADQQSTYLPPFTEENAPVATLAITEPRPLFDPISLDTKARRQGGDWILNGTKSLVARANEAELFLIAADAEEFGPVLFIVESGTEGLSVTPEPAMGIRAATTQTLTLEDVRVPSKALLGGGDPEIYPECIQRSRVAWGALAAGVGQAVLDYVKDYVNDRVAFGEPISHRQAVAFTVSDIAIELEGLRLATYRAAALADQGRHFGREAALARRLTADKGMEIGSHGVQLLGGHGFVKEHPVERWYRDLRAAGMVEGVLLV
jgi:alkylation response protein AidB-like acyl-CoA dehydrogenase